MESRKGFFAAVVFVMVSIYSAGVVYSAVRGSVTWEQAETRIAAALVAFTLAAATAMNGWSREDAAEKGKPESSNVTIAEVKTSKSE